MFEINYSHYFIWLSRLTRQATQGSVINDVLIRKGTEVVVPVIALHYLPEYWTHPLKYDPDR